MIWRVAVAVVAVLAIGGYWFSTQFPPQPPAPTGYAVRDAAYQHVSQAAFGNGPVYGRTTWSGAHRDARNSDYVPVPSPNALKRTWTGIERGSFFMPPVIGANGNVYATSAGGREKATCMRSRREAGCCGRRRRCSRWTIWIPPPTFPRQWWMWMTICTCRTPTSSGRSATRGRCGWVTDLPALGVDGYAFSAFFTHQGHVGLISSDGKVALFDRASGELALPILDLPGVDGVPSSPMPPGLLADGLIDPALQQDNWDAIWGFNMEVANTPSVSPETGRIFIVATGRQPDHTVLYGLDVQLGSPECDEPAPSETGGEEDSECSVGGIEIAFETQLGVSGSGTSPTVSFDGSTVYVVDGRAT